jgi:phosphoribosylformimino-5-aminoimidazole carboxamide ribotide isomerase
MRIYPAIDLMDGKCVRLKKGCFENKKIYSEDPLKVLESFEEHGLNFVHIVDLDGARSGSFKQFPLIKKLISHTKLKVQIGGGIRDEKTINSLLEIGAERIIIGSLAASNKDLTSKLIHQYGNKIVLALDIFFENLLPKVAVSGWQRVANENLWQLLDYYQQFTATHFLCTDIHRDGLLQGPSLDLYAECYQRYPQQQFIVSGGIRDIADINACVSLPNISATIVGTALYENAISLKELVKC